MKFCKILSLIVSCTLLCALIPVYAENPAPVFDGSGMTIAILDRGFDLSHESFVITDTTPRLTKEKSDALIASTSLASLENVPETLYVSAKVPFAYDYGDGDTDVYDLALATAGTSLLSIAAGNGKTLENDTPGATGIAPEAQVIAMKVHSTLLGNASIEAMTHAINDAVVLGADVILIGIVSMEGYDNPEAMRELNAAIENAETAGISVIASAGSVLNYGSGSALEEEYGENLISTNAPDTGTVAWPGCLKSTIAVTSADSNTLTTDFFTLPDGTKIPYGDSNYMFPSTTSGVSFDKFFDGKTLEYVPVGGMGTPKDVAAAGDLTGKLALVGRGDITFVDKAKNAAAAGALGIIVIDNQADKDSALTLLMDLTDSPIPAVLISSTSGVLMKSSADMRITLKDGETLTTYTRATPALSSNAVSGPTPELLLKPDIAAVGDSVKCAAPGDTYASVSSSRAAAARVAGAYLLVKARTSTLRPDSDACEIMRLSRAALVSSAQSMSYLNGSLYSPRTVGGGAMDTEAALGASLVLTSGGSHKVEFGEAKSPIIKLRVTAHNISDKAIDCTLDAIVGSDSYEEIPIEESENGNEKPEAFIGRFTELPDVKVMLGDFMYQLNRASENYDPYTFTLAPGEERTFTLTLYISENTYNTYRERFENGFFTEGYIRVSSGDETASIPYLGFVGDYSAAPSLDTSAYSGEQPLYEASYLYRYISAASGGKLKSALGTSDIGAGTVFDAEKIVFSPVYDRQNAAVYLSLGLLRNITDVSVGVYVPNGDTVREAYIGTLMRTHMSPSTDKLISPQIYIWDGRAEDNSLYIYPDGEYTVRISYRAPFSKAIREVTYPLYLDSSAPKLVSHEFVTNSDGSALYVSANDNFAVSRIAVSDSTGAYAAAISDSFFDTSKLTGKYLYIEIYDLAANSSVHRVQNPSYVPED